MEMEIKNIRILAQWTRKISIAGKSIFSFFTRYETKILLKDKKNSLQKNTHV